MNLTELPVSTVKDPLHVELDPAMYAGQNGDSVPATIQPVFDEITKTFTILQDGLYLVGGEMKDLKKGDVIDIPDKKRVCTWRVVRCETETDCCTRLSKIIC